MTLVDEEVYEPADEGESEQFGAEHEQYPSSGSGWQNEGVEKRPTRAATRRESVMW